MVDVSGKNIFVSGPMTGYENYNTRAFVATQVRLKLLGAEVVYNPILPWVCEPLRISQTRTHESYMLECVQELSRMREDGSPFFDLVVQLPGWQESEGAKVEDVVAESCGIERVSVFDLPAVASVPGRTSFPPVSPRGNVGKKASQPRHAEPESDSDLLWESWDSAEILWMDERPEGGTGGRIVTSRSELASERETSTVVLMQREFERHGIHDGDVLRMRVSESVSEGMNACLNEIDCRLTLADGIDRRLSFGVFGPAVPDRSSRRSEQYELENVKWDS